MQRACSETMVLDAERSFEPAISRSQLSALPAELWRQAVFSQVANFVQFHLKTVLESLILELKTEKGYERDGIAKG